MTQLAAGCLEGRAHLKPDFIWKKQSPWAQGDFRSGLGHACLCPAKGAIPETHQCIVHIPPAPPEQEYLLKAMLKALITHVCAWETG